MYYLHGLSLNRKHLKRVNPLLKFHHGTYLPFPNLTELDIGHCGMYMYVFGVPCVLYAFLGGCHLYILMLWVDVIHLTVLLFVVIV